MPSRRLTKSVADFGRDVIVRSAQNSRLRQHFLHHGNSFHYPADECKDISTFGMQGSVRGGVKEVAACSKQLQGRCFGEKVGVTISAHVKLKFAMLCEQSCNPGQVEVLQQKVMYWYRTCERD